MKKEEKELEEAALEDLKKKLEGCENQKNEYLAGWQRARADLLNYKKEEMERTQDFIKYAQEEWVLKILPVLDNFELAQNHLPKDLAGNEYLDGIFRIKNQIQDFLKNQGIEEIKSAGEKFNPNFHEIIEELEVRGKEYGVIIEEIQKGYTINGRLLRPAKVRVAK